MASEDLADLLEAISLGLREAGADAEADHLQSRLNCAYTSSSEWYGEIGLALKAIRGSVERRAEPPLLGAIEDALDIVREVWPGIG